MVLGAGLTAEKVEECIGSMPDRCANRFTGVDARRTFAEHKVLEGLSHQQGLASTGCFVTNRAALIQRFLRAR